MISSEQNTALVNKCLAYAPRGDRAGLESILSRDVVIHAGQDHRGVDGLLEMVAPLRAAFPDLVATVDQQFAHGDYVTSRFTLRGTHRGAAFGVPPTGRDVEIVGMALSRCENGRIAEEWELLDVAGLLQQIGALPDRA
jgi:steroid delta-isomerase-like uncharacterized protein